MLTVIFRVIEKGDDWNTNKNIGYYSAVTYFNCLFYFSWTKSFRLYTIGCPNDQNKAKLQKWSKSNDLHRFDVKTINNVELRRKTFKTTQNYKTDQNPMTCIDLMSKRSKTKLKLSYKSDQNPMTCIDLTSKRSKILSSVVKHSKQRKTTKPIKIQWLASIWCQNDQKQS